MNWRVTSLCTTRQLPLGANTNSHFTVLRSYGRAVGCSGHFTSPPRHMDLPYGKYRIHPSREASEGALKPHHSCPAQADKEQVLLRNLKTGPAVLKNSKKHIQFLMLCKLSCTKVTESQSLSGKFGFAPNHYSKEGMTQKMSALSLLKSR